jgi:hypothetical protein
MNGLLHSRKFWLAFFALIQTLIFQFFPQFPQAVWQSIDGVVVILIMSIATEDAGAKIGTALQLPSSTAQQTQATLESTSDANSAKSQPK